MFEKSPTQRKGAVLREQKRMTIQGRVDIHALAACAKLFDNLGIRTDNRSDLLNTMALMCEQVVRNSYPNIKIPSTAEEAFVQLEALGIRWKEGRARRVKVRILEDEDMRNEGFGLQSSPYEEKELYREALNIAKQKMAAEREREVVRQFGTGKGKDEVVKTRPSTGTGIAGIPNLKDSEGK